jgi:signal transduction histidine kinase
MTDAKDPVCGMTVKQDDGRLTSVFKGETYYFCSEKCRKDFDEDPEAVLAMKTAREKAIEGERSASLDIMIDEVAHEVRNPLTSIGGFARKVYKRLQHDDPNREYLEMIIDEVDRLENIVGQLIKLSTNRMPRPEPLDVNMLIHATIDLFRKELQEKGIDVKLALMNKPPFIELDRSRITSAIANIIRNAIEAMEKAPKLLEIATRQNDGHIEIEISDTGRGIPEDKIRYIFDPLFTSKIYGPGLGLTFVKKIIQEHEGTVSVSSRLGNGTSFTVRLPFVHS